MTFNESDFERIVVEVIRRLRAMGDRPPDAPPASPHMPNVGPDLVLTERVIALRSVEGRLVNVQRVVVPPRAVVTPAVRDELKERKIELVRQS